MHDDDGYGEYRVRGREVEFWIGSVRLSSVRVGLEIWMRNGNSTAGHRQNTKQAYAMMVISMLTLRREVNDDDNGDGIV